VLNDKLQGANWVGAGLSFVWMAFFIVCMFVRTNLPDTAFAIRFLSGEKVIWTLGGSFIALLILSMVVTALLKNSRADEPLKSSKR
jgi:hypothetical protein